MDNRGSASGLTGGSWRTGGIQSVAWSQNTRRGTAGVWVMTLAHPGKVRRMGSDHSSSCFKGPDESCPNGKTTMS